MGFNLSIGELGGLIEYGGDQPIYRPWVARLDGAELGAPLDPRGYGEHKNINWPSYSAWRQFCRTMGGAFHDMMYGELMASGHCGHNDWGYTILRDEHLAIAEKARKRYLCATIRGVDWNQVRIDWFVWWVRWSLENCTVPVFVWS